MTLAQARKNEKTAARQAKFRRTKLRFYRMLSKRPWKRRKPLIEKWLKLTREAEAQQAHWHDVAVKLDDGRAKAMRFYSECQRVSNQGRPYAYGGGHGALSAINSHQGLDCSSSTGYALHNVGLFEGRDMAIVSGAFNTWGAPGRGKFFTVWYNGEHVWTQFHGLGRFWRFDTSPWGSGGRGPRVRIGPRPTRGFAARHFPGL
jgi:hypothetical protein